MKKILFVILGVLILVTVSTADAAFTGTELLGRPTNSSVTINVVADTGMDVYFEYGTESGVYTGQTAITSSVANKPAEGVIDGLQDNTRYYYRMVYREVGSTAWIYRDEHSFHTQRATGSAFTFTIISDSHMNGGGGNVALYQQTLNNVLTDSPDFHLDLGDTFWMDGVTSSTTANQRYLKQRQYMGTISHSVPIFVSPGNHENEEGWNFDDTPSKALLSVNARKLYYPNPTPDNFYSGNTDNTLTAIDGDHLREDYYAWEWGDALFVVIDPYQYTMIKPYAGSPGGEDNDETVIGDRWSWTLGEQQYQWFKQTIQNSNAKFKFVFAHHVTGGTEDYVRGGAAAVPYCEWGGYNTDGTTWGFDVKRPGWDAPIHQLMVANAVTAFFHGHDHEYAYEKRDGIVYQLVPSPSMTGYGFNLYQQSYPYTIRVLPNPGHLRVTVSPSQVTVDYVATTGGTVNYTYTITANSGNHPPVANNQSVTTNQDTAKAITLTANDIDGDKLTYSIVTSPIHGTLSGTLPNVTYTPVANYNGSDSFTFKANDGTVDSNIATVSITVSPRPTLTSISVSPASASVAVNSTQQFTATGKDQFGNAMVPQPSFTWTVSGGGTISSSGLFTAGSTAGGPYTVTAASGGMSGTASVTVTSVPVLTSISVSPASASVAANGTQQFTATGKDQFGNVMSPQPSFTWTVSGGGTINSSGLFTAGSTAGGPYTVTAASGGVSGTASVTVTSASTFTIGETNILSADDSGNGNLLIAQQVVLGQNATILSMSFYVTTASGNLRLGIYDATGPNGAPGALKAQTAAFTPVSGWNTQNVVSPVSLPAGTYWLAYLPSSSSLAFRVANSGSAKWYSYSYQALPATFSTSPMGGTYHWSFYATLQ